MVAGLSRPLPPQGPLPILIGGSGRQKTLRTAARHADLWNGYGEPSLIAEVSAVLEERCAEIGRDFGEIRRTVTMDIAIRDTRAEATAVHGAVARAQGIGGTHEPGDIEHGLNAGGPAEAVASYVNEFAAIGVHEVIWVFRSPFDVETISRLGEVRSALV